MCSSKATKLKEKLTQDIICYGLWQTKEDVVKGVAMEKSKTTKLKALKNPTKLQETCVGSKKM